MKLTVALAVVLIGLIAGCGSSGDQQTSTSAQRPPEGLQAQGGARGKGAGDPVGSQVTGFHGKVSLHFNAYGDYGHCTGAGFGHGDLSCYGKFEASPDNTPPFCCNNRGAVYVQGVSGIWDPLFCGAPGEHCLWRLHFVFDTASQQKDVDFTCYVAKPARDTACYTDRDQPAGRIGEEGGPLRLFVGNSEVFGVHGYIP